MSLTEKLTALKARHEALGEDMQSPYLPTDKMMTMAKEYAELESIVRLANRYLDAEKSLSESTALLQERGLDAELRELAEAEKAESAETLGTLTQQIKLALIPKDPTDSRNVILEVRAGTGGEEASLFAMELFRMYQRHAQLQGWRFEIMEFAETDLGGCKEAVANISGQDVYARLKFESGVHRVQRVPKTEAGGRIHTSAATVAVLPEVEDVDVHIEEKDLRIDTYRSSGAGGQHVNTTDSAVRITHIPTGVVAACQDERSQHKNKAQAMKMLRARIFDEMQQKAQLAYATDRKEQVGSGDRSERIRTYNFPQGRVTDHRINLTLYKLDRIMTGDELEEVIENLVKEDQVQKMVNMVD